MTIEYNEESQTVSIDRATYDKLTTGTDFQRSINMLGYLTHIIDEMKEDALECVANQAIRERLRKKLLNENKKALKDSLNKSGIAIDPEAMRIFFS